MSKAAKSTPFSDLTPGPDTASSDVNTLREPEPATLREHVAAATSTPPPPERDELQDARLKPYFKITGEGAWARGADGEFVEVVKDRACLAAAQIGAVDESAIASAAAACARDHRK